MNEIDLWVHKDGRTNTVAQAALVVVEIHNELPTAFEAAIRERMNGGGISGHYIFTDRVGKREDGSFLHFHHACYHESEEEGLAHSLEWARGVAAAHGIEVRERETVIA